ncbi:hypothetical protein AQPW35_54310 [Rubrivivax pictus]|uniref:Uncharacterized protein n=1 Tax=Pseudaquabacterium pictum TaxID=2315236 RepID=A0A480AZF9_9BURK|nr:hypothetical protein AQPW35_54310 [Rubrivivax pictus]
MKPRGYLGGWKAEIACSQLPVTTGAARAAAWASNSENSKATAWRKKDRQESIVIGTRAWESGAIISASPRCGNRG